MKDILKSMRPSGTCRLEPLETRRLLAFSDVDIVPGGGMGGTMAADALGNVYVPGFDGTNTIVRQGSNGGTTWTNILEWPSNATTGFPWIYGLASTAGGEVYAAVDDAFGRGSIWQKPAGDTQFHQVHSGIGVNYNWLSVHEAGKAYAISPTSVPGPGNQTHWRSTVWRQTGPLGAFETVDILPEGHNVYAIAAGPQGVFAVGRRSGGPGGTRWMVRKSVSGDPGTWAIVDDFQYDPVNKLNSSASTVSVDAGGNVYVAGTGYKKVRTGGTDRKPIYSNIPFKLVRTSLNGGASWTTDVVLSGSNTRIDSVGADFHGNVYVTAYENGVESVRVKAAGGTSWTTIDQISNGSYEYSGTAVDSSGNVYVAGTVYDGQGGNDYGFVRMQPAAVSVFPGSGGAGSSSIFADSRIADTSDDRLAELI